MDAIPGAARAARQFIRDTLHQWELDDMIDDAALVVSELVTNAVIHGVPDACEDNDAGTDASVQPILLQLVDRTTSVLCIVHDTSCTPPHVNCSDILAETCRGLRIVDELSTDWGWTPSKQHGKFVWAVLDATRRPDDALVFDDAVLTTIRVH